MSTTSNPSCNIPSNSIRIFEDGSGGCACLSVRLDQIAKWRQEHGKLPDHIIDEHCFSLYQIDPKNPKNISSQLFWPYIPQDCPVVHFRHEWQYLMGNEIDLTNLKKFSDVVCPFSQLIGDRSYDIMRLIGHRNAVLYRGTDKSLEIPNCPYQDIIELAESTGSESFFVQTDEEPFYWAFKAYFPDTIRFERSIMVPAGPQNALPDRQIRPEFLINYIACLRAIGNSEKLVCMLGNSSLWSLIFRGHTENVWQYNVLKNEGIKL